MHGKIVSLADYGAFVDLGGVDGLLHVGDQIAVGQHCAFGEAGGAPGILQQRDVVGEVGRPPVAVTRSRRCSSLESFPA